MLSQEVRRRFLQFFKDKNHAVVKSSSVVPHEDPTLLFNNAGMNQFKDVFLGRTHRDYNRAVTAQKCIRVGGKHNDLDNVGHTARHLTFFEMLGNFSFGDYFKETAIEYAWAVTTEIYGFSPEYLWITVFEQDDEAFELWKKFVPESRIVRMGEKDNFWAMGDTGPCGPCSELYYDKGSRYGNGRSPKEDTSGERYLEFWNLVFMQFNRDASGKMTPLPKQSIDTGAGLERIISLKMGVDSVFETDILRSLIAEIEQVSGKKYHRGESPLDPAFQVIADHLRSLSFAIADGAQPSNIERGYVLRKLLRRAVRYGRGLGMQEPFLTKILPRLIELMGEDYPELKSAEKRIGEILFSEEEAFLRTLKRGGNILSTIIDKAQKDPLKQISGEEAFKLKDTYGFPIEEVLLIAKDTGLQVNLESYELLEEKAKEKSRSAQVVHLQEAEENLFKDFAQNYGPCTFLGYKDAAVDAKVIAIVSDGAFVDTLEAPAEALVLLDKTPFYAEKGGQVADTGWLSSEKVTFCVSNCQNPYPQVIVHLGKLEKGTLRVGESVFAAIDTRHRGLVAAHHTATHLLHWALVKVLGEHIRQAGSLVASGRLRFDFNHHKPLSIEELRQIEELVNEKIRQDAEVKIYELSYEEAQKRTDVKQFFGEKYGAKVRVIDIDFSKELCGGTHVPHLGVIGLFRILKESSIAAGVRRIEAAVGKSAEEFMYHNEELGAKAALLLKTTLSLLPEKLSSLLEENKELQQKVKAMRRIGIKEKAKNLFSHMQSIEGVPYIASVVDLQAEELPLLAEDLLSQAKSLVVILAAKQEGRCHLLIKISSDLVQKGIHAAALIKEIAPLIGGSGGGKADMAQAGGKHPENLEKVFELAIAKLCLLT